MSSFIPKSCSCFLPASTIPLPASIASNLSPAFVPKLLKRDLNLSPDAALPHCLFRRTLALLPSCLRAPAPCGKGFPVLGAVPGPGPLIPGGPAPAASPREQAALRSEHTPQSCSRLDRKRSNFLSGSLCLRRRPRSVLPRHSPSSSSSSSFLSTPPSILCYFVLSFSSRGLARMSETRLHPRRGCPVCASGAGDGAGLPRSPPAPWGKLNPLGLPAPFR